MPAWRHTRMSKCACSTRCRCAPHSIGARVVLSLHEFDRINRRMHNKLFIADNAFAVSGGRNIADEYFMRSDSANFIDIDVLSSGPVVRELSDVFDRYWNSEQAYPVSSVTATTPTRPRRRERFDTMLRALPAEMPVAPLDGLGRTSVEAAARERPARSAFRTGAGICRHTGEGDRARRLGKRALGDGQRTQCRCVRLAPRWSSHRRTSCQGNAAWH